MLDTKRQAQHAVEHAWSLEHTEVVDRLTTDAAAGLSTAEAVARQARYGRNLLETTRRRRLVSIVADQFKSIVVLLLIAAGILAMLFSDNVEALAIFAVIAINATIGFLTEWRAIRSMEALSRLGHVETAVIRDGVARHVEAAELVPGDIVLLDGGDIVAADLRLIEAAKLQADESTLTGESLPIAKSTGTIAADTLLMDRDNMLFKGTAITRGSGRAVVVGTGFGTELGRISKLVTHAEPQRTPLEKRLDVLAQRLVWAVLALAVTIGVAGILAGRETVLAIEVAIALAVAAIPEGLPIVATLALARGMWRMARHNALISRLSAVETLGATSVILTDKTGTLTENRMTVTRVSVADSDVELPDDHPLVRKLLIAACLCSNASLRIEDGEMQSVGDPTEVALLAAAWQQGLRREALLEEMPELREIAFDPETKRMATLHAAAHGLLFAVKGAPEAILPLCTGMATRRGTVPLDAADRRRFEDRVEALGQRGLRTLALARKKASNPQTEPYADLELLGIVGLEDPPRHGVGDAIRRCQRAGVRVVMVTGDHHATAKNIGDELGIDEVHARVTPVEKLELIDSYQRRNEVVAMTGDGVNDAPALKKADIGVAMGVRGTAVAKEAAAMVLLDDDFGTIVEAVAQGRTIFENIRKFVVYLLSCNISEVLIVSIATLAGAPLPLLPLQILFLNLVTDVFPALALGLGEGSPALMRQKPRSTAERVLMPRHWVRIGLRGLVIALSVLGSMSLAFYALEFDYEQAVTVSFTTLALAQVWHVFNMRNDESHPFVNEITRNIWIWVAVVLCVVLVLLAVYVPVLNGVLRLVDPGADGWLLILGMSFVPVVVAPLLRRFSRSPPPELVDR
ncbi:MAG: cation-translocating P-type ATPase [Woeseiaceae bacterium]|nr:cation-translocating P-type ATPase [Woeseiaceae bacterium]